MSSLLITTCISDDHVTADLAEVDAGLTAAGGLLRGRRLPGGDHVATRPSARPP